MEEPDVEEWRVFGGRERESTGVGIRFCMKLPSQTWNLGCTRTTSYRVISGINVVLFEFLFLFLFFIMKFILNCITVLENTRRKIREPNVEFYTLSI